MNRYICQDLYEFEVHQAFQKWRQGLNQTHQSYHNLQIQEEYGMFYLLQNRLFCLRDAKTYLCWNQIYSLYKTEEFYSGVYLPQNYYYTNGSHYRLDATYGFN